MDCVKKFFCSEDGAMTLEAAIITAALVALALVFRNQLGKMWKAISGKNKDYIDKLKE
jgi:Flp pilus assembly pilin Flp